MTYVITRREAKEIDRSRGWVLVYGRRKTGKTYMLKNFVKWDHYYLVRKDGSINHETTTVMGPVPSYELARAVGEQLRSGLTVIVDEFQRLPQTFLDDISTYHPSGKLILTGSSFRVMKDVFGSNSPVLGLFAEHRVGLVGPSDIISSLSQSLDPEKVIEYSAFARDPWMIPHLFFEDSVEDLFRITNRFPNAITGLIGEVFQEEERSYTQLYEAILRLLGAGYSKSDEISSILFSRGIIKRDSTSSIIPMLNNMEGMDLVTHLNIHRSKRKKTYLLKSPIFELFFRLADRFDIENREVDMEETVETVQTVRNLAIQRFVGEIFASRFKGVLEYSFDPELDFIITRKGRPVVVGEVKWGRYDRKDIVKFIDKASDIDCPKVLVTKVKCADHEGIEIFDASDMIGFYR